MSERTLGAYVEQLRRFRPEFLHGYPSAIILLAEYLERHGEKLGAPLKAVLLASEGMYPGQRETLERVFACRPFSWYGHSERLILAGECTAEPGVLHHFPDYGILEIVGETGNTLHEDGVRGELVGTGLWNRSLPLIRYRTEDTARLRAPRCACGRCFDRFDQVEGRWRQEYIIGKTGARISPSALNMHGPIFQEVVRYQYYQNRPGSIELRVMTTGRFADTDANAIRSAFLQKVGGELDIALRVVEDIPLTARGKLRRLIQELPGERALKDKEAP
jgi:phenylacetate-CoA ligase